MCGISGLLLHNNVPKDIKLKLQEEGYLASSNINYRGPDRSVYNNYNDPINISVGFNRLAIRDLSTKGDQPFVWTIENTNNTIIAVCNGEIYNVDELCKQEGLTLSSGSDCEIIPLLYNKYGINDINKICNLLNSEHAFVIFDINMTTGDYTCVLSTDRYSVRPLFIAQDIYGFYYASELSGLPAHCLNSSDINNVIERFKPGHYAIIHKKHGYIDLSNIKYGQYYSLRHNIIFNTETEEENKIKINEIFTDAVNIRLVSDRPFGCLLSGGVDSSLVAAKSAKKLKQQGQVLMTFSIGLEGGTDEKYAKMVAEYIGSKHTHFTITVEEALKKNYEVAGTIGSFDITTCRATPFQLLLLEKISIHFPEIKMMLCGDFSDEICGSYKYGRYAPDEYMFDSECRRLIEDIHEYDGLRADRSISHYGVEARFPFADYRFIDYYLSCRPSLRVYRDIEKQLLRSAFDDEKLLPQEVLWRKKEAFSDGVSSVENSWFKICMKFYEEQYSDKDLANAQTLKHLPPQTKEALHYRLQFCKMFGNNENTAKTIPYYWMPKWVDATDPSARTINS
jgi:asparagine synthase (glutamine-hydrolysing)